LQESLWGVNDLGINVIEDPDFVEEVVDFTTSVIFEYAKALLVNGYRYDCSFGAYSGNSLSPAI